MDKIPENLKILEYFLGNRALRLLLAGWILLVFSNFLGQDTLNRYCYDFLCLSVAIPTGIILVIFGILIFLCEWINAERKICLYKERYPISNLDKKFYLLKFGNPAYLIDNDRKKIYWIKSWQTAIDLEFTSFWTDISGKLEDYLSEPHQMITTKSGKTLTLKGFEWAGKGIHTRGTPGS